MSVRGILRKSSPTKKRSLTTQIPDNLNSKKTIQVINHNDYVSNGLCEHREKYKLLENNLQPRYSAPVLNTATSLMHNCENLKKLNIKPIQNLNDLTPRTKTVIAKKVRINCS